MPVSAFGYLAVDEPEKGQWAAPARGDEHADEQSRDRAPHGHAYDASQELQQRMASRQSRSEPHQVGSSVENV